MVATVENPQIDYEALKIATQRLLVEFNVDFIAVIVVKGKMPPAPGRTHELACAYEGDTENVVKYGMLWLNQEMKSRGMK